MKIDLSKIDEKQFIIRSYNINSCEVFLVFPKSIACKWDSSNVVFRSSCWDWDGNPVSLSYKKFWNWGEQPELGYTPFSLTSNGGCSVIEKIDGSTLIISRYKRNEIIRTRGTLDAREMENGNEIDSLREKYPLVFNNDFLSSERYSIVLEWVSPLNRIVLNYGISPDIFLTNIIDHTDYSYCKQDDLDKIALKLGVNRPKRYVFSSIKEMHTTIESLQFAEGVCVYCNYDQDIRKIKSDWYKAKHRLKTELGNFEHVVDLWFASGKPDYNTFIAKLSEDQDFELLANIRGDVSRICDGYKEVGRIIEGMNAFVEKVKKLPNRKEQAIAIQSSYGKETNRSSFVFSLLDGKELSDENLKKLLWQVLKR